MRETDINEHFLAAVLQMFIQQRRSCSVSANLPSGSISRFCLIFDANMLVQNVQQVLSDFWRQFGDIVWYYRLCMRFVAFLLSNIDSMLCLKSVSAGLAIWEISSIFCWTWYCFLYRRSLDSIIKGHLHRF